MSIRRRILFVTGTDTGVGKTVTVAGIAATLQARAGVQNEFSVAVDKPTQTGVSPSGQGDMDEVRRLSGVSSTTEGIRLPAAMAPVAAASAGGSRLPALGEQVSRIQRLGSRFDSVIVEGAGGLLVQLDEEGNTLADMITCFAGEATAIVVCRAGLGTLNHTELTLEALRQRNIPVAGTVIGSWPEFPNAVELSNRRYLDNLDAQLLGALPENASALPSKLFQARAPSWLPRLASMTSGIPGMR